MRVGKKVDWEQMGALTALDVAAAIITLVVFGFAGFPVAYIILGGVLVAWYLARMSLSRPKNDS